MRLQTTTSGNGIHVEGAGAVVEFQNVDFGAIGNVQANAGKGAYIGATGNYSITGGAERHIHANHGQVRVQLRTVTITGTPAFLVFASSIRKGLIEANAMTFSGTSTGVRYNVDSNSVIFTNGGGGTYFPGSQPGTVGTGGQYL